MTDSPNGRVTKTEREVVAAYLERLKAPKPRGRQRTLATAQTELADVLNQLAAGPSATTELLLIQRRLDLEAEIALRQSNANPRELELEFIAVAKKYGQSRGISHAAWRAVGVPASVLHEAGIK